MNSYQNFNKTLQKEQLENLTTQVPKISKDLRGILPQLFKRITHISKGNQTITQQFHHIVKLVHYIVYQFHYIVKLVHYIVYQFHYILHQFHYIVELVHYIVVNPTIQCTKTTRFCTNTLRSLGGIFAFWHILILYASLTKSDRNMLELAIRPFPIPNFRSSNNLKIYL